ncbi:hypothetical protein [Dankookia sp. P2]|uniref:hypothetical protein n=1 Tax=Dankookia sp. P2 TaxID=3423955 RepID=UPI003D668542
MEQGDAVDGAKETAIRDAVLDVDAMLAACQLEFHQMAGMHRCHPLAAVIEPAGLPQHAAGQVALEAVEGRDDQEVLRVQPARLDLRRRQPTPDRLTGGHRQHEVEDAVGQSRLGIPHRGQGEEFQRLGVVVGPVPVAVVERLRCLRDRPHGGALNGDRLQQSGLDEGQAVADPRRQGRVRGSVGIGVHRCRSPLALRRIAPGLFGGKACSHPVARLTPAEFARPVTAGMRRSGVSCFLIG